MKKFFALLLLATPVIVPVTLSMPAYAATSAADLGDLSEFATIAAETLLLVQKGDLPGAEESITKFETAWDAAHTRLRPMNVDRWGKIDDAADAAIASLRAKKPVAAKAQAAVRTLIAALTQSTKK